RARRGGARPRERPPALPPADVAGGLLELAHQAAERVVEVRRRRRRVSRREVAGRRRFTALDRREPPGSRVLYVREQLLGAIPLQLDLGPGLLAGLVVGPRRLREL